MAGISLQIQSTFTASPKNMADFDQSTPPSDFFLPHRRYIQGEQRLMLAVLEDAVEEFQRNCGTTGRRGERLLSEVERWFWSEDDQLLFSFENICSALEIDAGYLRRGLIRWKALCLQNMRRPPKKGIRHEVRSQRPIAA